MAKDNRSDYMRWARRRSTEFLTNLAQAAARQLGRRMANERVNIHPKNIAAIRVLHERGVYNPPLEENQK